MGGRQKERMKYEGFRRSMCGFDGIQGGNYFGEEPIGIAEVEVRVG